MNKYDGDVTADTILKLESHLATPYVRLAEMFYDNEHVKRECYLTAFSLRPHKEIFEYVKNNRIIRENEKENLSPIKSIECTHEVFSATSSISKVYCKYCGKYRNADDEDLLKSCEILLNAETLANVPTNFHSDLIILVESPRIKQLSWSMPWHELEMNCQKLMDEERKLELTSNQLVNANDQLQYIDLDYSIFQHLPEAEVPGIEKGYEQYLISSEEEDESDEDFDEPSKIKKENNAEKKNYVNYFESSDESDKDYRIFGQRRKKDRRKKKDDASFSRSIRTNARICIDKSKTHVPPKKRLHKSLKTKVKFDYNDPHARFYIVCRKAQLDIKKQRVRLLHKRNNKYFHNFLEEMQIKKSVNENLVKKNVDKLALMNKYRGKSAPKNEDKSKVARRVSQKLVFSSGVVAKLSPNGCVFKEKTPKRKEPPANTAEKENDVNPENATQEKAVKKKKVPRPKVVKQENGEENGDGTPPSTKRTPKPKLDADGNPQPSPLKKKRVPKPKLGPDGQPLVKPVRRPKPKKIATNPEITPSVLQSTVDPSKYEAAEILAQLGGATFNPATLINHTEISPGKSILKMMLDNCTGDSVPKKVLTEHNGVSESGNESVEGSDTKKIEKRGRPKGVKNKIKLDADGNPLPKPPRKPNKSRKSQSSSTDTSLRDSFSSVASSLILKTEIKEEFITPPRDSVIVSNNLSSSAIVIEDNPCQLYEEPVLDVSSGSVKSEIKEEVVVMPPIDLTEDEPPTPPPKPQKVAKGVSFTEIIGDDGIPVGIINKTTKRKSGDMMTNGDLKGMKELVNGSVQKKVVLTGVNGIPKPVTAVKGEFSFEIIFNAFPCLFKIVCSMASSYLLLCIMGKY